MGDIPDIAELVKRSIKGDHQAFAQIIRFYTSTVAGTVGRYARNESDREDLAQDVFLKAYKSLKRYKGTGSFEGWLRKITIHTCLDWLRKQKRKKSVSMSELSKERQEMVETTTADPKGNTAQKRLESQETRKKLHAAMEKLPPDDHLVIVLKELEGKSLKEISAETGWSESNVKVKAHRAREKLKAILIEQGEI